MRRNSNGKWARALLATLLMCGACGGDDDDSNNPDDPLDPKNKYSVAGTVWGLTDGELKLQINEGEEATVTVDGTISFPTKLQNETAYTVKIAGTPKQLSCYIFDGSGTISGGDSKSFDVSCVPVATLALGRDHACKILSSGSVKCWGNNNVGQLGLGDTSNRGAVAAGMGQNLPAVNLGTNRKALMLVAGESHTCALLDDESVKCWGQNYAGQLGLGDVANRGDAPGEMGDALPSLSLGSGRKAKWLFGGHGNNTCALLDDRSTKCWGYNSDGQLGTGSTTNIGSAAGQMGDSLPTLAVGTGLFVRYIETGYLHTCATLSDNSLRCWGLNGNGQLGLGNTTTVGDFEGQIGDSLKSVSLDASSTTAVRVSTAWFGSCAILSNRNLKCWGENTLGNLGLGDTDARGDANGEMGASLPIVNVGSNRTANEVVSGWMHSCARLDNNTVKCWGDNGWGQLGIESGTSHGSLPDQMGDVLPAVNFGSGRTAIRLVAGRIHNCALLDNDSVKCWGNNDYGQLGNGTTGDRGGLAGSMGDALPAVMLE